MPRLTRLIVVVCLSLPACKSTEKGAKEEFSKAFTCPTDRVEVHARKDLRWSALTRGPPRPPEELAGDPGRLALWMETEEKSRARADETDVFEGSGCEHKVLLGCSHPPAPEGGTLMNRVTCVTIEAPPAP